MSLFLACRSSNQYDDSQVLVEFKDKVLTVNDIKNLNGIDFSTDSLQKLDEVKKQWLRNQILLSKANKDLGNIEKQLQLDILQYKADWIRFKYDNYFLANKVNRKVAQDEIKAFYDLQKDEMIAEKPVFTAVLIIIPSTINDRYKVRNWIQSDNEKDLENLKLYCFKNAKVYDDFQNKWIDIDQLHKATGHFYIDEKELKASSLVEKESDGNTYYIWINQLISTNQTLPLEVAKDKIVNLIVTQRKVALREDFDQKIEDQVEKILQATNE
ncbi:MAG: hypothetical protein JXR60_03035 [Bacteroidales bacterium]|nr:hypothetical protein [Bacteroidales bacterium]